MDNFRHPERGCPSLTVIGRGMCVIYGLLAQHTTHTHTRDVSKRAKFIENP